MVEKITRLNCHECDGLKESMSKTLAENREVFYNSEHTAEFEKDWLDKYIMKGN